MVFSSVLFLFRFLPIFMICYFLVPRKMKNLVLFLGSLVFYAWGEPVYVVLLILSAAVNFWFGIRIDRAHLYFPHAFFYHIRLCVGKADRRIQREGSLQDLFAMFHCHQSFYPGIF